MPSETHIENEAQSTHDSLVNEALVPQPNDVAALSPSSRETAALDLDAATDQSTLNGALPVAKDTEKPRSQNAGGSSRNGHSSPTALQDMFLNGLRRENIDAVIYFCDGSQERGAVRAFDTFTILLENRNNGKTQLIYKRSIARIFPTRSPSQLALPARPAKKSGEKSA